MVKKRPPLDLAAAMEADLKSHDPMSTRSHETKKFTPHENMSGAPQEPIASKDHESMGSKDNEPKSHSTHETKSTSSHENMRSGKQVESYIPPSRSGMKRIQGYFSPRVKRQFRLLAVNSDVTEDELVSRALNLLFKTEGLPEIAFDGKERSRGDE